MNKVILMGRLVKDPEVRYSQSAEPVAVCKYTLAVNRKFKREGEPDADFINCVAFGKIGEFAEKYFKKGQLVSVIGSLRVRNWDNAEGVKQWTTEVVLEDQYFAESKASFESSRGKTQEPTASRQAYKPKEPEGFTAIDESVDDDDLPF